jgi:hypothetical protein
MEKKPFDFSPLDDADNASSGHPEAEFLIFYRAQESTPMNQFRQAM